MVEDKTNIEKHLSQDLSSEKRPKTRLVKNYIVYIDDHLGKG
jgi:hypothetical protein